MNDMFRSWRMEIRVCCLLQFRSHPLSVAPIPLLLAGCGRRLLHPSLCMRACARSVASHQCKRDPSYLSVTTADTLQWKHSCWNQLPKGVRGEFFLSLYGIWGSMDASNRHVHPEHILFWIITLTILQTTGYLSFDNLSVVCLEQPPLDSRGTTALVTCFRWREGCWSLSAQIYW